MDESLRIPTGLYQDAIEWIYGRINYERIRPRRASAHFRLDRIRHLLSLIGSPQERIPAVHIAGTKGKGSTAAMLDVILQASGVRSGLFTSPHIDSFEERMRVSGTCPAPFEVTELVTDLRQQLTSADASLVADGPTYFEVATLLAWKYFDRCEAELVVLETGLGGRLDCTNVCRPLVTVITSIGLDHTHLLGNSHGEIAWEKAGILKPRVPFISGVVRPSAAAVCEARASELACSVTRLHRDIQVEIQACDDVGSAISVTTPWNRHDRLRIPLHGIHQTENAALAVASADLLARSRPEITAESVRTGLLETLWPLRFDVVSRQPTTILDAAHNSDAASAVVRTLNEGPWQGRPRILIFSASCDKDAAGMLSCLLPSFDVVICTRFERNPRSRHPEELLETAGRWAHTQQLNAIQSGEAATDKSSAPERSGWSLRNARTANETRLFAAQSPAEALGAAESLAGDDGLILATGSLFLAAELRALL